MMENKTLFEVTTAWPFPILQYTANTSYVEVRKASGIAYILLQLISSSGNNSENLVSMLKNLGVPSDIHYIFAGELVYMTSYGIIQMKFGREFSVDLIDMYAVSDFEITNLGKKLFKEGTIPTGNNKVKRLNVFYDVSRKDTQMKFDMKLFRLDNSTLDEKCIGDVVLNDFDVEMFINENMNNYSFRKGERISGFEHETPEILVYKMDDAVTIKISQDGAQIQAKDKVRDFFIHQFYSTDTITRIIDEKKKYHFPEFIISEIKEYDFSLLTNVSKLYMPSQMSSVTKIKNQLALDGKCKISGSECSIDSNESIELMRKCDIDGVACYFEDEKLYSIIPGRFLIDVNGYDGKCAINLIVVQQLDDNVQQQLMRELFLNCIETSAPLGRCDIIKKLTQISKYKDYLEQFTSSILRNKNSLTEKIELFTKVNDEFIEESEWEGFAKTCAMDLFDELCSQITVDRFASQNILGKKLNKIMLLHDIEYLTKISKKLVDEEDNEITFEALESVNYSTDVILSIVNVFETYCKQIIDGIYINGNSKLSRQCTLLGQVLSELRELTGIDNPFEDSSKIDFDNDRFTQVMATFTDSMKKIEKYKAYAMDQYKTLVTFRERFVEIKEVVTIEKEASKNPKNINKNYIEQRIKKSRYKDAICDLHVRLQYELNRLFNTEHEATFNLLSDRNISNYLNKNEVDDMHALRKCRNGFQHSKDKREVQYSEKIIRKWCSIVEKLGGMENESRSEN